MIDNIASVSLSLLLHLHWRCSFSAISVQFQCSFSAISVQFQSSFSASLGQFQSNFRAVSEQFQSSFRAVSEQFQCILRTVSEQFQSRFRAVSEQFQSSFRAVLYRWFGGQFDRLVGKDATGRWTARMATLLRPLPSVDFDGNLIEFLGRRRAPGWFLWFGFAIRLWIGSRLVFPMGRDCKAARRRIVDWGFRKGEPWRRWRWR